MTRTRQARDDLCRRGITPGGLPLEEAAAFVGISPNSFLNEVEAGTMPPPLPLKTRRKIWSRAALARVTGGDHTEATKQDVTDEIDRAIEDYAL